MLGIIAVVFVLMGVLLIASTKLNAKLASGRDRISSLTEQTQEEQERTEEIEQMQQDMQSDEYKEQVAKDKLGLIHDGEIIFKEQDNN